MKGSIYRLFFILFMQETSQHQSCCLRKEVDGIEYEHIDDHGMLLPSTCKDHCVYKKVGETGDNHYCFGVGQSPPKCILPGELEAEECSPFVTPQPSPLVLIVNTTKGQVVYGPWSDERLSAFQFEVQLDVDDTTQSGYASLSFTPCFNCYPVYQNIFELSRSVTGTSLGFLYINDVKVKEADAKPFKYRLSDNKPAKFLIQTIPMKGQNSKDPPSFRIKAQFVKPDNKKEDIYDVTTTFPNKTYNLQAPYGITYAIFGSNTSEFNTSAATYTFNDVDRSPDFFPIADCREGENAGLTAVNNSNSFSVNVTRLNFGDPTNVTIDVKNVDPTQRWCIVSNGNPCTCPPSPRGHIQPNGPVGAVISMKYCKFLKASRAFEKKPGTLSLVDEKSEATKFLFIVAPNTEINQLRFGDNNVAPFTTYVVSWNTTTDFNNGEGIPVTKIGRETNPLTSCFKAYKFLSNVQ